MTCPVCSGAIEVGQPFVEIRILQDDGTTRLDGGAHLGCVAHVPGHLRTPPPFLATLTNLPVCTDCPVGGREGQGPVCPRAALCDWECSQDSYDDD